jgi:hypothetical protein
MFEKKMDEQAIFCNWKQACEYVGDDSFLKEMKELYFHYKGFASVEVDNGTFDRVYVDGYLKLNSTDVNELRKKLPVIYSSAIIDRNITINGVVRDDLLRKFLVFDDELLIGADKGEHENEINYPYGIHLNYYDLNRVCSTYGIERRESGSQTQLDDVEDKDSLQLIGALAYMLAMHKDLEGSLQSRQHISEIIIDDLFEMLSGIGFDVDGKQKFQYEKLITDGVKTILDK